MSIQTDVFAAADKLFSRGIKPSERKVRDEMGGGSYRDIGPALKLWWKERGQGGGVPVVTARPTAPASPDELIPRHEMEAAIALIEERAEADRRHLMAETDRMRQEMSAPLQAKNRALEDELLLARARLRALEAERR